MDIQALAKDIPVEGEYSIEGIDFIANGDQYLTFLLGNEQYAVDILAVEEIRGWENPTLIPNSPAFVKGVINLRGIIVPVFDLRMLFNIGEATYSEITVVIVLKVTEGSITRTMGYVVDAVSDVLDAEESDIKKAQDFGGNVPVSFIKGLVNVDDDVVTILNTESLQLTESANG